MDKKRIVIKRLIWDDWNITHIARHDVTPEDVQEVCDSNPVERKGYRGRIFLIGSTKTRRMLSIILEPTAETDIYKPITAFDASKRSIQDYQEEKKKGGEAA